MNKGGDAKGDRVWMVGLLVFFGLLAAGNAAADAVLREGAVLASIARVALVAILLGLIYRGHAWARYLTAILFLISAAVAGSLIFTDAPFGPKIAAGTLAAIYVGGFVVLGFARPILRFEAAQRKRLDESR